MTIQTQTHPVSDDFFRAVYDSPAVLAIFAAPVTPIALALAGLGPATGTAIPGAQWLLDWREGKQSAQENGLHYLLTSG